MLLQVGGVALMTADWIVGHNYPKKETVDSCSHKFWSVCSEVCKLKICYSSKWCSFYLDEESVYFSETILPADLGHL